MANVNKLKGKMVEKDLNVNEISKHVGMNKSTFYRKMSANGNDFTVSEVKKISGVLNLTVEEVTDIFLS